MGFFSNAHILSEKSEAYLFIHKIIQLKNQPNESLRSADMRVFINVLCDKIVRKMPRGLGLVIASKKEGVLELDQVAQCGERWNHIAVDCLYASLSYAENQKEIVTRVFLSLFISSYYYNNLEAKKNLISLREDPQSQQYLDKLLDKLREKVVGFSTIEKKLFSDSVECAPLRHSLSVSTRLETVSSTQDKTAHNSERALLTKLEGFSSSEWMAPEDKGTLCAAEIPVAPTLMAKPKSNATAKPSKKYVKPIEKLSFFDELKQRQKDKGLTPSQGQMDLTSR